MPLLKGGGFFNVNSCKHHSGSRELASCEAVEGSVHLPQLLKHYSLFWCLLALLWLSGILGTLDSVRIRVQYHVYDTESGNNPFSGQYLCMWCLLMICFIADPLISHNSHHFHWLTAKWWHGSRHHCMCVQLDIATGK